MSRLATIKKLNEISPVIAPSMLKCDFSNLHREIELLEAGNAEVLHLDVMDGHFVPNLSYGPMVIERIRQCTNLILDAHLMISDPDKYLDEYIKAGCDCITVHYEANINPEEILTKIKEADIVAGLAINPDTPVNQINEYIPFCDMILVMSVNPGFGGQTFMPVALNKLKELNKITSDNVILSVDGGIGINTISQTAKAGANLFVAGSSIFDTNCYTKAITELRSLAETT